MSSKVKELQPATEIITATRPRGTLFVVSSPSGGGKGTIIRHVLDVVPNLGYSVSFTTRAPRLAEMNGREYFFVSREVFEEMVAAGEFLEWACVHGNFDGTAKRQIADETSAGMLTMSHSTNAPEKSSGSSSQAPDAFGADGSSGVTAKLSRRDSSTSLCFAALSSE